MPDRETLCHRFLKNIATSHVIALFFIGASWAQTPVSKGFLNGVAIGGIDTVAYFDSAAADSTQAVKGDSEFEFEWNGATWRFADQAALDKFAASPERWVPEFNGHCANALSLGEGLIRTDGSVWQFFDDKLYLFYAPRGLRRWQQGEWEGYLVQAEAAWAQLTQ